MTYYGQFDSIQVQHDLKVDGASTITGATTITGALTQTGAAALASTLSVAGAATLSSTLAVTGLSTMSAGLTITVAAAAATATRALRIATTQATPAMEDGYGVIEKDLTVTGTATGHIFHESSWINLGTSAVVADYCIVHNDGVWDGTATLTNANVAWGRYHCMLASNPGECTLWSLNFDGAHSEIDAIFATNDATLALGYQAGTPTKAAVGSVPFNIDSNGTILYIYLYDDPDSD
jgi:hypothetical protein